MRSRKGDSLTAPTVNPRAGTQAAASAIIVSGLSYRKRHSGSPEVALRTARCIIGATAEVKAASATQGLPRQVAQVTAKSRRQRPARGALPKRVGGPHAGPPPEGTAERRGRRRTLPNRRKHPPIVVSPYSARTCEPPAGPNPDKWIGLDQLHRGVELFRRLIQGVCF